MQALCSCPVGSHPSGWFFPSLGRFLFTSGLICTPLKPRGWLSAGLWGYLSAQLSPGLCPVNPSRLALPGLPLPLGSAWVPTAGTVPWKLQGGAGTICLPSFVCHLARIAVSCCVKKKKSCFFSHVFISEFFYFLTCGEHVNLVSVISSGAEAEACMSGASFPWQALSIIRGVSLSPYTCY